MIIIIIIIIIIVVIIIIDINSLGKKQRKKKKNNLGCPRESNPGLLASATSALTTELRQPSTSKTLTFFLYTVE